MRGLASRVRRLEAASGSSLRDLSDAELDRRIADLLALVLGKPVQVIEAAIPMWRGDGTLAFILAALADCGGDP